MSRMTKEINKITGTIIGVSGKLILYAVILLLLFEGMSRGYRFGHEIFYAEAMEEAPGTDKTVTVLKGQTASETAKLLHGAGLIDNQLAFEIQKMFYDYDINPGEYKLNTSMTSKEILQAMNEDTEEDEAQESGGADSGQESGAEPETDAADAADDGEAEGQPGGNQGAADDGEAEGQPGGNQGAADGGEPEIQIDGGEPEVVIE